MITNVGYLVALLGGMLALASPCSAMLLPGFFAYAFGSGARLLVRTLVFYAGLAVVLVPLGMGAALLTGLVYQRQETLTTVAGVLLIGLGVLLLAGGGFTVGPLERLRGRIRGDSVPAVFTLGAVSGVAGFCAGPILGAVLTVAAASGQPLRGGVLLALYALGMTTPLFILAALWDRFDLGRKGWLRGRGIRLGRLRLHTTTVLSALIFIGLGVLFIATNGTQLLTRFFLGTEDRVAGLEAWLLSLQEHVPDLLVVAVAAVALVVVAARALRR